MLVLDLRDFGPRPPAGAEILLRFGDVTDTSESRQCIQIADPQKKHKDSEPSLPPFSQRSQSIGTESHKAPETAEKWWHEGTVPPPFCHVSGVHGVLGQPIQWTAVTVGMPLGSSLTHCHARTMTQKTMQDTFTKTARKAARQLVLSSHPLALRAVVGHPVKSASAGSRPAAGQSADAIRCLPADQVMGAGVVCKPTSLEWGAKTARSQDLISLPACGKPQGALPDVPVTASTKADALPTSDKVLDVDNKQQPKALPAKHAQSSKTQAPQAQAKKGPQPKVPPPPAPAAKALSKVSPPSPAPTTKALSKVPLPSPAPTAKALSTGSPPPAPAAKALTKVPLPSPAPSAKAPSDASQNKPIAVKSQAVAVSSPKTRGFENSAAPQELASIKQQSHKQSPQPKAAQNQQSKAQQAKTQQGKASQQNKKQAAKAQVSKAQTTQATEQKSHISPPSTSETERKKSVQNNARSEETAARSTPKPKSRSELSRTPVSVSKDVTERDLSSRETSSRATDEVDGAREAPLSSKKSKKKAASLPKATMLCGSNNVETQQPVSLEPDKACEPTLGDVSMLLQQRRRGIQEAVNIMRTASTSASSIRDQSFAGPRTTERVSTSNLQQKSWVQDMRKVDWQRLDPQTEARATPSISQARVPTFDGPLEDAKPRSSGWMSFFGF